MKFILLAAAALAATATPALAQDNAGFTGARIEATAGYNDIINSRDYNDVVYGAAVGIDVPAGDKFTVGAEVNTNNVFERNRTFGVAGRVGYAFTPTTLGYVKAGYANYRDTYAISRNRTASQNLDGGVIGAGIEHKISNVTYVKAEYRYTNYADRVAAQGVVAGVGFRF